MNAQETRKFLRLINRSFLFSIIDYNIGLFILQEGRGKIQLWKFAASTLPILLVSNLEEWHGEVLSKAGAKVQEEGNRQNSRSYAGKYR